MTKKTFLLDSNVLLHDPESLKKFPNQMVVIPLVVLEDLEKMKRLPNELGKNSRAVFQFLDDLAQAGDLHQGVGMENGSTLRIQLRIKTDLNSDLAAGVRGNRILLAAFYLKDKGDSVVLVSKDFAVRIKAEAFGIEAEDYENLKFCYDSLYRGVRQIPLSKHEIDLFYKDGAISVPIDDMKDNEYAVMKSEENSSALGKYDSSKKKVVSLVKVPNLWGIKPLNVEQKCAIDMLLRDDIKLVTLIGPAGTGKTLLALACGMRKVFDEVKYTRILVSRPIVPLGKDIGYLPGTKEEKLFHWMQPIYDNLEFLCSSSNGEGNKDTLSWVMDSKKIEMEAVTYIRGRSLPNVYIIVDEAQNLTPHEMKTIISRAGQGAKVILTGDPSQIDNPYLDKDSNGLTYTVGCFANHRIFGHIFLERTERSELAALAAEIL